MATPGALENVDHAKLVERIANGAIPQHLAAELGVHHASIYRLLAKIPDAAAARKIGMACRLDTAEEAVFTSDERTLPRAREMWRCVTWRAEREHPDLWGATNKLAGADGGPLQVQIVQFSGRTIEHGASHTPVMAQLAKPASA